MWKQKNDAVVEYSRDIGMLVVSISILKIKCNLVDLAVAGLMSYSFFFPCENTVLHSACSLKCYSFLLKAE